MAKWLRNNVFIPIKGLFSWLLNLRFSPKQPQPPHIIPPNTAHVPTGPNLVKNGSFELGNFGGGTANIFQGSGTIQNWNAIVNDGFARWIDKAHPVIGDPADGNRLVDLTGGAPPVAGRKLANLFQDALPVQSGQRYEVSFELGVGTSADVSSGANFGAPVSATISILRPPVQLSQQFVCNPLNPPPPASAFVRWERFAFRFEIPVGYVLAPNQPISIRGVAGHSFIGVDNVSLRLLT